MNQNVGNRREGVALVREDDTAEFEWRKSSYSGGGNDCVEVAHATRGIGMRDSKAPAAGALWVAAPAWRGFRTAAVEGILGHG